MTGDGVRAVSGERSELQFPWWCGGCVGAGTLIDGRTDWIDDDCNFAHSALYPQGRDGARGCDCDQSETKQPTQRSTKIGWENMATRLPSSRWPGVPLLVQIPPCAARMRSNEFHMWRGPCEHAVRPGAGADLFVGSSTSSVLWWAARSERERLYSFVPRQSTVERDALACTGAVFLTARRARYPSSSRTPNFSSQ